MLNIGSSDIAVGIATRYSLNGPCCESWWGRVFPACSDRLRVIPRLQCDE